MIEIVLLPDQQCLKFQCFLNKFYIKISAKSVYCIDIVSCFLCNVYFSNALGIFREIEVTYSVFVSVNVTKS